MKSSLTKQTEKVESGENKQEAAFWFDCITTQVQNHCVIAFSPLIGAVFYALGL